MVLGAELKNGRASLCQWVPPRAVVDGSDNNRRILPAQIRP